MTTHLLIVQVLSKYTNTTNNGDNMKKLISITILIMLCVSLTACMGNTTPTEEISTHTLPPTQAYVTVEPEWAPVDSDIALMDSEGNTLVTAADFETFALVGTNDDDSHIKIMLNDSGYKSLLEYTGVTSNTFYLYLNGEEIEEITYADNVPNPIEFGHDKSYEELCQLAGAIRGLF